MSYEADIKALSLAICKQVDEDEAHIVDTQFPKLLAMRGRSATLNDEGQFEVPTEAVTYASLVVTFVGGIFADAAKDVAKEQLVGALKRWLAHRRSASAEAKHLRDRLLAVIDQSKASNEQRSKLKQAISSTFQ